MRKNQKVQKKLKWKKIKLKKVKQRKVLEEFLILYQIQIIPDSEETSAIVDEAIYNQDASICEGITDEKIKKACKINVIVIKADKKRSNYL